MENQTGAIGNKMEILESKVKIKKAYLKYAWKWKVSEDYCQICQESFSIGCIKCEHPFFCQPVIGDCKHTFHLHCLEEWLEQSNTCPLCRKEWVFKKVLSSDMKK